MLETPTRKRRSEMDVALTVPCPYCGAEPHESCRHTMLPGNPPVDIHQARIEFAEEPPF